MRYQRVTVFYINANVLQNFHICITVPLNLFIKNIPSRHLPAQS